MPKTAQTPAAPPIQVGRAYSSREYPHISREVLSVSEDLVRYSVIDSTSKSPFRKAGMAALSDFLRVSEVTK